MARLSASSLWRAAACPAYLSLPHTERRYEDAERGRKIHAEMEAESPDGAEVALAYDVLSGRARLLPGVKERQYPNLASTEIAGTTDKLTVEDDTVVIRDYKSGAGFSVAPPRENLQLLFYAVAAAAVHGKQAARVEIEYVDREHPQIANLDGFDLADARARIRKVWEAVQTAGRTSAPRVVSGDHCWRCPAVAHCPAHREVLIAFGNGLASQILPDATVTPELIAEAWPIYQLARRAMGNFEAAVRAYVGAAGPVPLGNGKQLIEHEVVREQLDGRVTRQVLRDMHGEQVADAAVQYEATKKKLEEAIGEVAPRGKKAAMVRAALAEIELRNGIMKKRSLTLDVIDEPAAALPPKTEAA